MVTTSRISSKGSNILRARGKHELSRVQAYEYEVGGGGNTSEDSVDQEI
jgi:hypothetical protein